MIINMNDNSCLFNSIGKDTNMTECLCRYPLANHFSLKNTGIHRHITHKYRDTLNYSTTIDLLHIYRDTLKARRGSGFDEIFCIFANMSCLCIHLVTLFNLPCKKKIVMKFFFLCRKISFFHHPKVFISVK